MGRKHLAVIREVSPALDCRTDGGAGEGKKATYELTGEENTLPNLTGKMGKIEQKYKF